MSSNINLSKHNKQINKVMQQNVQSERPIEGFNYSQQRNSIPSKIPESEKILHHQTVQNLRNSNQLQIVQHDKSSNKDTADKLKLIDEEIKKEKQLIQKLKIQNQLQKQQLQNTLNKSFLSLNPKQLARIDNYQTGSNVDELLQTKTQADFSFLENRKNQATKELQTEEQKYRQNIRKMQLKRIQMKKKLKQDQQIPIKVMDFKDLQKKKESKKDDVQPLNDKIEPQQEKSIFNKQKLTEKHSSQKNINQKSDKQNTKKPTQIMIEQENGQKIVLLLIETESRKQSPQRCIQVEENKLDQSFKVKENSIKERKTSSKKQYLQSKSKISQQRSRITVNEENDIENKSRITGKSSNKKYSVKLSSVIVPQINDSIKQIQDRKSQKRYQNQPSIKKSITSHQEINLEPQVSQKSRSRVSSVKQQTLKSLNFRNIDQQSQNNQQKQEKSFKRSINKKSIQQQFETKSQNNIEKSVHSFVSANNVQQKAQVLLLKQKSISVKSKTSSKKQQKVQLMYIPHTVKQISQKSFKKTDKSIQWSEVDISMYGKTNQVLNSQTGSRIVNELNQQMFLQAEKDHDMSIPVQAGVNKINMKKNKSNQNNFFEQVSQKQRKSEKSMNLEPIQQTKQKSFKESVQSKLNKSRVSMATSRQGSVNEKVDRYDRFHRQHSLKNQKVQNNKLATIENLNQVPSNKNASYRSRKSNPVSNSSISKSKAQTVARNQKNIEVKDPNSDFIRNSPSDINESRVLISKEQINLLHTQIRRLEEKLSIIEQKQQKLANDKTKELKKLEKLAIEEENIEDVFKHSLVFSKQRYEVQEEEQNLVEENQNYLVQGLISEIESESKQLVIAQSRVEKILDIKIEEIKSIQQHQTDQQLNEQKDQPETQKILNQITIPITDNLNQQQRQPDVNDPQIQQNNLQNSYVSQKQTIQQQINHIAEIESKFTNEKQDLLEEINRLKKVIRQLQIQKIKSINHQKTIEIKDQVKLQRPQTQINQTGVIVHQDRKNQTLDPIKLDEDKSMRSQIQQKSPFGKIIRNSPDKNSSRFIENLNSSDKKFRINISKKSSVLSDSILHKNFESAELPSVSKNSLIFDEQGNGLLLKKKNESYPINQKQGYIVLSNENEIPQNNTFKDIEQQQTQKQHPDNVDDSKVRKIELTKEQILQRFHRTNRQFNNFIESSRIINETNSSMSSQNNLFLDKTYRSGSFPNVDNKFANRQEEDNPQNAKLLHKLSSSNLELHKDNSKQNFQQSFTRIVDNLKDQSNDDQESDQIPYIQVGSLEIPDLPQTPDISFDQDQLMQLARQTFKIFDIEVKSDDTDFNMKKYKNCVIFTKATQTILWHYNGKFYIGGWKGRQDGSGEKTGFGTEIVHDKHIYKGQFMNGKKHGTGIMKNTNGNYYDGQWIEGIKNGQGIYYDSTTKVIYQGEWKDGKKNGFGVLKFSQRQYYQGTFVKSVKEGYGIEVFVNGDKYRGQYRKGKFHGKGKYTWANTSVFEGDFCEGMRHGHGTWKSAKVNADVYVGTYENDKKSGYGRYVWSNGCIYEGNFAEDVKHGKGRLIYTDGRQIKGVWQEGSLLEAVTQNPKEYHQEDILKKERKTRMK